MSGVFISLMLGDPDIKSERFLCSIEVKLYVQAGWITKSYGAVSYVCLCLYATLAAERSYCLFRSLPNLRAWRSSHLCRHLVTWR